MTELTDKEILDFVRDKLLIKKDSNGDIKLDKVKCDVGTIWGDVFFVKGDVFLVGGNIENVDGNIDGISGNVRVILGDTDMVGGNVKYAHGNVDRVAGNVKYVKGTIYGFNHLTIGILLMAWSISLIIVQFF
jgi:DUF4097 and DUF4098 domain-containing protein YvlB